MQAAHTNQTMLSERQQMSMSLNDRQTEMLEGRETRMMETTYRKQEQEKSKGIVAISRQICGLLTFLRNENGENHYLAAGIFDSIL